MGLQKNWSESLKMLKKLRGASYTEMSEDAEMSRSTIQDYLKGKGNPTLSSIDHIAEKLGVDPVLLVAGTPNPERAYMTWLLMETLKEFTKLPKEDRRLGAELFYRLLSLFGQEDKGPDAFNG